MWIDTIILRVVRVGYLAFNCWLAVALFVAVTS